MKQFCRFILFVVSLVIFTLNTNVVAQEYDAFSCSLDEYLPDKLIQHCPELENDLDTITYTKSILDATYGKLRDSCKDAALDICLAYPEVLKKYSVRSDENCKEDLQEILCENIDAIKDKSYCLYHAVLSKIISQPARWEEGKETDICQMLLDTDDVLCTVTTHYVCKRLDHMMAKAYCHSRLPYFICLDGKKETIWNKAFV